MRRTRSVSRCCLAMLRIAAPMAGKVAAVHVKEGESVAAGVRLVTTEAMIGVALAGPAS